MTPLEVTLFVLARAEVGGKKSENGSDSRPPYSHQDESKGQTKVIEVSNGTLLTFGREVFEGNWL